MSFSLLLIVVAAAEARLRQSQFFFFTSFDQSVSEGLRRLLCLAPCVALRRISAPEPTSVLSNMMRYFAPYQPVASFGQPKHVCELPARQAATESLGRDARKASTSESKTDYIVRWVHTKQPIILKTRHRGVYLIVRSKSLFRQDHVHRLGPDLSARHPQEC
jgi:hypothetical protein